MWFSLISCFILIIIMFCAFSFSFFHSFSPSLSRFVSAMSHYRPLLSSLITLCINSPVLHPSLCFSICLPSCTPMLHFMDYVFRTFCLSSHMLCELEGHSKQSVQCLALRLLLFVVQESTWRISQWRPIMASIFNCQQNVNSCIFHLCI